MNDMSKVVTELLREAQIIDRNEVKAFWGSSLGKPSNVHKRYLRYRATARVDGRVIFYETMSGDRMNDNPLAIFKYLYSHPDFSDYIHVWSVGKHGDIPA